MRIVRLASLIALLCCASACAQPGAAADAGATGTLAVTVDVSGLGSGGAAVQGDMAHGPTPSAAGIQLFLKTLDGRPVATLVTDQRGEAAIELPAGSYVLVEPAGPMLPPRNETVIVRARQVTKHVLHLINVAP